MSGSEMKAPGVRRLAKYERALRSVEHIIASPKVVQFCVGITGTPSKRRDAYRRWCLQNGGSLDGFALLDWDHSPDEIVRFERWLFERSRTSPKYANAEGVQYFPNVNRKFDSQVIYVAWWSPAFWNG